MRKSLLCALLLALGSLLMLSGCDSSESSGPPGCTTDEECIVKSYDYCHNYVCVKYGEDGDNTSEYEVCDSTEECQKLFGDNWECAYSSTLDKDICQEIGADGDCEGDDCIADGDDYVKPYQYPRMLLTPSKLDFGAITYGTSDKKILTIKNNSNFDTDLVINKIYIHDKYSDEFEITNITTEDIIITQQQSVDIEVSYASKNIGCDEAQITIVSNAGDDNNNATPIVQYDIFTLCKGVKRAKADPMYKDFGETLTGEVEKVVVTVTNECPDDTTNFQCPEGGNKVLEITEVIAASDDTYANYFNIVDTDLPQPYYPVMLPPTPDLEKGQYKITFEYNPQSTSNYFDPHRGRFYIVTNSDEPSERIIEVNLEGYAEHDLFEVLPTPIDFKKTYMNCDAKGVVNDSCNTETTCTKNEDCPSDQVCRYDSYEDKNYCFKSMEVEVYNWDDQPVVVKSMSITNNANCDASACYDFTLGDEAPKLAYQKCQTNTDCQGGSGESGSGNMECILLDEADDQSGFCHLRANGAAPGTFMAYYRPTVKGANETCCIVTFEYQIGGIDKPMQKKPIIGLGSLPNVQPIARISRQSHGQLIEVELNNIQQDTKLAFYGNISEDPDGSLSDFSWVLTMPDDTGTGTVQVTPGSENLRHLDTDGYNVLATFTRPGKHILSLTVTDDEGMKSEPCNVVINVRGNQGIDIVLEFEGAGAGIPILSTNIVDMDLYVTSPDYGTCSDDSITSNKTCVRIPGALMTHFTNGAGSADKTMEEFVMKEPVDGQWCFGIQYVNDCEDWVDLLIKPFCASHHSPADFTLELYDPLDTSIHKVPWHTIDGEIRGGQTKEWCMVRIDGVFADPEPR